jgi:hypothetical protein
MFGLSFVMALGAFAPGYCRHRRPTAALLGAAGIVVLAWTVFAAPRNCCGDFQPCCKFAVHAGEMPDDFAADNECQDREVSTPWLMSLGGLFLVAGHLANRRSFRTLSCADDTDVSD